MQFKGFIEFSFLVEDLYFFCPSLHAFQTLHSIYSLYIGSVNTVGKASHQLNRADYFFYEMILQKDSDDENKLFLIILFSL